MKNLFYRFLCFVLLFPLLFLSCTQPKVSSTKSFQNAYFSLQYPATWNVEEQETNISIIGPQENEYFVNLKIDFNSSIEMNLEEFMSTVETQNQLPSLPGYIDGGVNPLQIGGHDALQRTLQTTVPSSATETTLFVTLSYLVLPPSLGIVITTECPVDQYLKYKESFASIQDSIQFGE